MSALMAYSPGYGQESNVDDWTFFNETDGIKSYYRITACNNESALLVKIANESASDKEIIWVVSAKNLQDEVARTMPQYPLKAGEAVSSDCSGDGPLPVVPLDSDFTISNLIVNIIIMP